MTDALSDMRVLDLSRLAPHAFATMILGDMGAEVIKIEAPPETGAIRIGPGSISPLSDEDLREGAYDALNRNKKSIGINLKTKGGQKVFYELLKTADVIVEGFRPDVAERIGIGYKKVEELNPQIVYCSLSGYGQTGPYRSLPGHDLNYISLAGGLSLMGRADGIPAVPLNLLADYAGGTLHTVIAILCALIARKKIGKGQYIDMSLFDGVISILTPIFGDYFRTGVLPENGKVLLNGAYPYYSSYETKDGKIISIGCIEPQFWENLCRELGREDFIQYHYQQEHFWKTPKDKKWEEIFSFLRQVFLTKTSDEWFENLGKRNIPVGKVNELKEVSCDPQVIDRKLIVEIEQPEIGKVKQIGSPFKLSETPGKIRNIGPFFGQHTQELLQDMGYDMQEIEKLRQAGAVK